MNNRFDLSDREIEILELLAQGVSNKEIATRLVISTNTVKVHLRNIFSKLEVDSRTEAAIVALRNNLVDVEGIATYTPADISMNGMDRPALSNYPGWIINRRYSRELIIGLVVILFVTISGMLLLVRGELQADLENSKLERWQVLADLSTRRGGFATVVYDNQVYVIGGETSKGITGRMERYDPSLDEWSTLGTKPLPVTDVQAVVISERIFVPGGRLETGEPTDVVEVYDPLLSQWSKIKSLPTKLSGYALVAFEGKLYLFGGWDGTSYVSNVLSYDPIEDRWYEQTPMLSPRGYAGAAVVGGVIYIVGGYNGDVSLAVNESYFPSRDFVGGEPWQENEPMPESRYAMGMDGLADNLYIFGGRLEVDKPNSLLQYSPLRNEWQIVDDNQIHEEWQQLGFVSHEGYLYVIGGKSKGKLLSSNYSFQAMYHLHIPVLTK